jgi:hypothetical protein
MLLFPGISENLLTGALAQTASLPLVLTARLSDLRPRFLPKGRVGKSYRAVARNGRVLLASPVPVEALSGQLFSVRLQIWHKAILPGDLPSPYGLLLCIRAITQPPETSLQTRLIPRGFAGNETASALRLDVGGGMVLEFFYPPR